MAGAWYNQSNEMWMTEMWLKLTNKFPDERFSQHVSKNVQFQSMRLRRMKRCVGGMST
jgi:hypothetical protein